jgi:hypothetical protein
MTNGPARRGSILLTILKKKSTCNYALRLCATIIRYEYVLRLYATIIRYEYVLRLCATIMRRVEPQPWRPQGERSDPGGSKGCEGQGINISGCST